MASSPMSSASESHVDVSSDQRFALISLTTLFFMWGFITCLNDILIPYLKGAFDLNYTQAMLVQFCFFGAYFIVSIPAGALVRRIGYQLGIVTGLVTASFGCFMFIPAANLHIYGLFLVALFVLAAGITILQVSANPYVTALGKPDTASSRLTMTQAFNALGTTVAPFFGAWLIFSGVESEIITSAELVKTPYLLLAAALLALAVVFAVLKLPRMAQHNDISKPAVSAWRYSHLTLGAIAIFVYVGAEVAIGSFLVNFLAQPDVAGLTEAQASKVIAYYWGGAMVGRFIGAVVMQYISAAKVLTFNACMAVGLILCAVSFSGPAAMWAILAVGLFNSIMFPTIFSLALKDLKGSTSQGSGILCLAIVGGAIVPLLQGVLADQIGLQLAFALPIICYLYIAYYGAYGSRVNLISE
ncbi:sugar MFS transporter [Alteromonas oceanisediminis]|uniref:sugar MFS transporter n=1 Tax=Alteromonas oceanisediminis TaxID=2836180 RepID=UPI001BDAF61F|nr:sugar MFS transporter [Alteromonas oceanisediminis]MBT0587410.1 sugar MFS transporter [Alteromonas oceanisediminis]